MYTSSVYVCGSSLIFIYWKAVFVLVVSCKCFYTFFLFCMWRTIFHAQLPDSSNGNFFIFIYINFIWKSARKYSEWCSDGGCQLEKNSSLHRIVAHPSTHIFYLTCINSIECDIKIKFTIRNLLLNELRNRLQLVPKNDEKWILSNFLHSILFFFNSSRWHLINTKPLIQPSTIMLTTMMMMMMIAMRRCDMW